MRKIKEVLRLHFEVGQPDAESPQAARHDRATGTGRSLHCSRRPSTSLRTRLDLSETAGL
jgi:hypothetical protein